MSTTLLPTPAQWKSYFRSRGIDEKTVSNYLAYIHPLHKNRVPVIFSREHLAKLLGRTESFLAAASLKPKYFYRSFNIPKRSGAKREINAPFQSLLHCQQWISEHILAHVPIHEAACGYVRKKSIIDHASPHVGTRQVITIDLKDFFPSIKFPRILALFRELGYTKVVSLTLARLCCLNNALPQGAATSPLLSNIICKRLDVRINRLCKRFGVEYTRYADDLCFSGDLLPASLVHSVSAIVRSEGFEVNSKKTRINDAKSNRKMVTGLNVAHDSLRLSKSYRRSISLDLHHIEKHGLISHIAKRKINDPFYLAKLLGKVGYWLQIEPNNQTAVRYRNIIKGHMSIL